MTIQTTTIPDVIDFYLAAWRALPECQAPVEVFDGMPDNNPDTWVIVGSQTETLSVGSRQWASLGGTGGVAAQDEQYEISCEVSSYVGGGSTAQKAARDAAFKVYRALEKQVRADPKCGGLLGTGWATFSPIVDVYQTATTDPEAPMGRVCTIQFHIGVFSRRRPE